MNSRHLSFAQRPLDKLAWVVTFGVVYGQLIPFQFRALPMAQAISHIAQRAWWHLSAADGLDWKSNLVMGVPFGFFVCGAISGRTRIGAIIFTLLFGTVLAGGTEFIQIWDTPRYCSLDDVIAQVAGTLVGILIWIVLGRQLVHAVRSVLAGGLPALKLALVFYVIVLLFVSLFPFDIRMSATELRARLTDPSAIEVIPRQLQSAKDLISLLAKAALMLPLGAIIRLAWRRGIAIAILAAFTVSFVLQVGQWLEYSGQAKAANVFVAMLGAAVANRIASWIDPTTLTRSKWLRFGALLVWPFYISGAVVSRGWNIGHVGVSQIEEALATVNWLPFYYAWFVSETQALASTLRIAASYAPVGALIWAMRLRSTEPAGFARSLAPSVTVALLLSAVIEAGGLITAGHRPDPTNLLIASVTAAFAQRVCEWLSRGLDDISRLAKVSP